MQHTHVFAGKVPRLVTYRMIFLSISLYGLYYWIFISSSPPSSFVLIELFTQR